MDTTTPEQEPKREHKKPKKLNKEQIKFAKSGLKDIHELENTPITVAYPWLGYLVCKKGKRTTEKEGQLTESLLDKSEINS